MPLFFSGPCHARKRPVTLPVVPERSPESRELKRSHSSPAGQQRKPVAPPQGLSGFSTNPFALEHRDSKKQSADAFPESGTAEKKQPQQATREGEVTFSGSGRKTTDDRLVPRRTAFSGGRHTLGQLDAPPPAPEVNMHYNTGKNATTRVVVNPQDPTSPLYRPAAGDKAVNSAGVYMQVEVEPNLRLQFGGEYCDIDAPYAESGSPGASVGLEWNF